jgi:formylmethanofuran dehydrogenase subunit C
MDNQRKVEGPVRKAPERMAAAKRFGSYKDEQPKGSRETDVKGDEVSRQLMEAMRKSFEQAAYGYDPSAVRDGHYNDFGGSDFSHVYACYPFIYSIEYTKLDIERLCLHIPDSDDVFSVEFSSNFIEALIRMYRMESFALPQAHLEHRRKYVGSYNSQVLLVDGDVGDSVGSSMTDGLIIVDGSAGQWAGANMGGGTLVIKKDCGDNLGFGMRDGIIMVEGNVGRHAGNKSRGTIIIRGNAGDTVGIDMEEGNVVVEGNAGDDAGRDIASWDAYLTIFGDAGDNLGRGMKGGYIGVYGNAGRNVGQGMTGGEIGITGDYESIGNVRGGKIYHQNKLIVDK